MNSKKYDILHYTVHCMLLNSVVSCTLEKPVDLEIIQDCWMTSLSDNLNLNQKRVAIGRDEDFTAPTFI